MKLTAHTLLMLVLITSASLFAEPAEEPDFLFSQPELDQMLAPIALYPDVLLSQVLMAATYPLEVVEAARWSRDNPDLEGEAARLAVADMDWDPSVKALVAFPDLIQLMDENLRWTRQLGDAFLAQEEQVMATAQNLRRKAMEEGSLDDLTHVVVEEVEDTIVIEPRQVDVVYVPYYRTEVVYGDWWWYDYPPYYWYPSSYYWGGLAFYWSRPYRISTHFYFSSCDWNRRHVIIHKHSRPPRYVRDQRDRPVHYSGDRRDRDGDSRWRHDPEHRRGVRYHDGKRPHRSERIVQEVDRKTRPDRIARTEIQPPQPRTRSGGDSRQLIRREPRDARVDTRTPSRQDSGRINVARTSTPRTSAPKSVRPSSQPRSVVARTSPPAGSSRSAIANQSSSRSVQRVQPPSPPPPRQQSAPAPRPAPAPKSYTRDSGSSSSSQPSYTSSRSSSSSYSRPVASSRSSSSNRASQSRLANRRESSR